MEYIHLTKNNVRAVLSNDITLNDTTIIIDKASAPYRNPPIPLSKSNELLHLTIVSSVEPLNDPPNKIEIVNVLDIQDINATQLQLTVERGAEDTSAYNFEAGSVIFLAHTKESIDSKANRADVILIERRRTDENWADDPNGSYESLFTKREDGTELLVYAYEKY